MTERPLGPKQHAFLRRFADKPFSREECTPSEKQWLNEFIHPRGLLEIVQAGEGVERLYAVTDKGRSLAAEPVPEKRHIVIERIDMDDVVRFQVRGHTTLYAMLYTQFLHIYLPKHNLLNWQDMEEIVALHRTAQKALKALVEDHWAKEDAEKGPR